MPKYTELQTRKFVSSYGGTGSIIEDINGSMLVENFENWPFFIKMKDNKIDCVEKYYILDKRLLNRLRIYYKNLEEIVTVPENEWENEKKIQPNDVNLTTTFKFFPEWFFCPKCNRFRPLNAWWKNWSVKVGRDIPEKYIPPKCGDCYQEAVENRSSKKNYNLEQVRFVITSPDGEIDDFPWHQWPDFNKNDSKNDENTIVWDQTKKCCDNPDLRYIRSSSFLDLAGIRVKCENCQKSNTLSGFFGVKVKKPGKLLKPVIRSASSVFFPIIIRSLYIPISIEDSITEADKHAILVWKEEGENIDFIFRALRRRYSLESIRSFIEDSNKTDYIPETEYRAQEYKYLVSDNYSNDNNIYSEKKELSKLSDYGFDHLVSIRKLKMTVVQLAYTRQEPISVDEFLEGKTPEEEKIKPKLTTDTSVNEIKYLPGVENFGEGIFISINGDKIRSWMDNNNDLKERIKTIFDNAQRHEYNSVQAKFLNVEHALRFVLTHTLSHIIIKELEFVCGYPATSLNERLFVDPTKLKQGFLIYTIAGAEGSYGGLVSQSDEKKMARIIKSALLRATDCASDPVCYFAEDGQGIGGINLAACFSCTLLPETSCEEFNSFLDRALLIDSNFGFFKDFCKISVSVQGDKESESTNDNNDSSIFLGSGKYTIKLYDGSLTEAIVQKRKDGFYAKLKGLHGMKIEENQIIEKKKEEPHA